MIRYLLRRVGQACLVVAGVVALTFVVVRLLPGDPASAYAGARATRAELAHARQQLGLDQPLPVQLATYVTGLIRGDWGTSLRTRQPVFNDLLVAFPASVELVFAALTIAVVLGVPAGMLAARYLGKPLDGGIRITSMFVTSFPVFLLAIVVQTTFATKLGWFPVAGEYDTVLQTTSPLIHITNLTVLDAAITGNGPILLSAMEHLALPVLVVAAYPLGVVTQMTRAAVSDEASLEHGRLERALGFTRTATLWRFSLRPALNPMLTVLALVFAYSLVNTFLVESVFNWPGLGRYTADSLRSLDTAAVAGVTLVVALTYVTANLLVDVLQTVIDPRVKLQ
ncbi:MAG: peptide ABC transporter permease [Microbacterium sp. 14-71-5]|uniref:ABC transporter permease n=1 Tax=Microbacterium sp. 13-71-7 TaxID=1970399 RepID=UPI000BD9DBDE|nr:ABC transporter permease [Microbacterium sp. 13-71-7]OZB80329.1 MAG: peptide ABC transporter permease [Microbacterium sp. 14-71-5]OZB85012.1 MAG: peptide ABC transporter permease [Microbacterium sp. 13-71-7]